jgi:putative addiction module CopG family antidote
MNDGMPLPPLPSPLAAIVRAQLASGRFRSENEVIGAALRLLEQETDTRKATVDWLKQEIDKGLNSRPSEPATKQFFDQLRARLGADQPPRD